MATPLNRTLTADTELVITLDSNCGQIEVALIAGAATTYFNTTDTPIPAISGNMDGNHVLTTSLLAKVVPDGTAGAVSKVRLRSTGTPTVAVVGQ